MTDRTNKPVILAALLLAAFAINLDTTIVNVALPTLVQDELDLSVVPIFLGAGERLFENLGPEPPQLEQIDAIEAPGVTHIRYRPAST